MITVETDVLVIGTGGAGCRAALEARKHVERVALLAKGPISKSELTIMTMPGFDACLPGDSPENFQNFFNDTMVGGSFLNDEDLVKILTEQSAEAIMFLEGIGVRFDRKDGKIYRASGESEKYTSLIKLRLDDNMGRTFMNGLSGEVARAGIRLIEDTFVTDLILREGEVAGAFGVNIRTGQFVTLLAKSTVLATGGAAGLYSVRTTSPRDTGDGYAMAYRAGADLIDMEFIQSNPAALMHPDSVKGVIVPGWYLFMNRGIKYLNSEREPFMAKYDPVRKEMTTRDVKAKAMHTEIVEGRGSKHGGVYLDFSGIKLDAPLKDFLQANSPYMMDYVRRCGLPADQILDLPVEIGPAAHYTCGGVRINPRAETSIPGLFAAGEASGGVHGANRLAGNAMTDIFVFGRVAGESAGRHARGKAAPKLDHLRHAVSGEEEKVQKRISPSSGRIRPAAVRRRLEEIMFQHVGFGRDEAGLLKGLEAIEEIRHRDLPALYAADTARAFNYERIQILELHNMVDAAEIIARSALYRRESRGCQNRTDYPNRDDQNWKKHSLVRKKGETLEVADCPRIALGQARG